MTDVESILAERGKRYGEFTGHAEITQGMKAAMRQSTNWDRLRPSHVEALEMICHKIGRIINGDPDYPDSWDDIAGYATLVSKELRGGE